MGKTFIAVGGGNFGLAIVQWFGIGPLTMWDLLASGGFLVCIGILLSFTEVR